MRRIIAILTLALLTTTAYGQQQQPSPAQIISQSVPIEGVMGYLAVQKALSDESLIKARHVMLTVFGARETLIERSLTPGVDLNSLRDPVFALRIQMVDRLEPVLTAPQMTQLREILQMPTVGKGPQ